MHHAFDGGGNHRRGVVGINHFDARREERLELGDRLADRCCGVERIATRGKAYPQARRWPAVVLGADRIALRSQLDLGHIAQTHLRSVGIDLQQDFLELLRRLQPGLADDRGVELLGFNCRQAAELAGRHLYVLFLDRRANIHCGQLELLQLARIEPDTHRVLGAEHLKVANAGRARDRVLHIGDDIVGQVEVALLPVLGYQCHHHQEVARRFRHTNALLLNGLRQ